VPRYLTFSKARPLRRLPLLRRLSRKAALRIAFLTRIVLLVLAKLSASGPGGDGPVAAQRVDRARARGHRVRRRGAESTCPCYDGGALRKCNTGLLFSSFFLLVKGRKIRSWRRRKRRVPLQTAKPDQVTCFQVVTQEISESRAKLVGKLYKCPDGNNAVSPTKCGNYEQSANGSQRAYKIGVQALWRRKK
jgi:hypothetical protein